MQESLIINKYVRLFCFFSLFSLSFISGNDCIIAAIAPINQLSLVEKNTQKQIFGNASIPKISDPKDIEDKKSPIFTGQTNSNLLKDDFTTFIVGINVGKRNVISGVLVRGKVTDKETINFNNWLIPYENFLEALKFTPKSISENEVELRSPFKIIRFNLSQLHNDPELGLVISTQQIKDILGIESKFDWREYSIVYDVPEVNNTSNIYREKKPVLLTGLPTIYAPSVTLSMVEPKVNLSGTNTTNINNQGSLSAIGTIWGSSWFARVNQSTIIDSKTWQLSELQFLKQTEYNDYYLGSQPTFWTSQSGGDFWGLTTIQRHGFSPVATDGVGGIYPSQRLQPERIYGTVTGQAEPGTLIRIVKDIYNPEVIAEQLVGSSRNYRFDNIPVGREIGTSYKILLYPNGVITAQPQVQDARFNLLPEQLSEGTSTLIISGGWKRRLNNNVFLGEFNQFNAGISQRWGITKDLTVGLGGVYDSSFQGLAEFFYQPQRSPLRLTISSAFGNDIKINTNIIWDAYPNFYATLSNDLKSTLYSLNYQISSQFRFYSSGSLDKNKNFGLSYFSSKTDSSTNALINFDTNSGWSWSLEQRLGKLYLNHSGNQIRTYSQLSYLLNPYQSLIVNYETLNPTQQSNLLTAYWRYNSPTRTRYGENLWQGELGYRIGSLGTGIYVTLGTTILPGILLQARYEGVSLNSDQSNFSIQLVSSLGFQQGIIPGDRQIERLRTQGGLLVLPFLDQNSNGKRDNNEEIYRDNSEFLIVNNEAIKPSQFDIQGDRIFMRLAPGTYRVDLEPAGFPPDFQPTINSFAVKVVEGSYTPILIPLQPSYTLAGIATDVQGKVIAGAKVEAIDPNSKLSVISITNDAGVFYLEQLRQGTYQLKINGKMSQPDTITIKAGSNTLQELNLKMLYSDIAPGNRDVKSATTCKSNHVCKIK